MNKNRKTKKTGLGAFDALVNEALEDDFLNPAEDEGVMDEYEDEISPVEGEEGGEDVTITVTADQAAVLKDILSQLEGEDYEDEGESFEDEGGEEDEDVTDIEELERESVETHAEKGADANSVINKTKSGKAADNTGELEGVDGSGKMGEEQQYKFVKRGKNKSGDVEKPEPKKYKVVSGSKATPDDRQ